ncbi:FKBP-type peptidyl-prolyl cis-trans isomerase [Actinokineospora sp. NBRC 105648]|uniref:FKBP-type peptidyl-prolyl cis-trans isomerase n=1 Tax=Actinokineospora sp. NBRC 105648 TaxID=3032206 RepID=UPI0024A54F72|nr:FKBP-type peptidyl-prolyl cis-trans isomerase [Actinokineospora sp. NBRC 105648]GLZ36972.1 peptidyl-prolyl cis-trans isomerase [Actinokineospora sp. NBRC 105648]
MRNVGKIMIVAAVGLGLAACANSEQASTLPVGGSTVSVKEAPASSAAAPTKSAPTTTKPAASTPAGPECTVADIKVDGAPGSKPTITVPDTCSPPKALLSKDLVVGTGAEVKAGSTMQTHYVLVTWSNKEEKDSSWKRGQPFPLENVGQAQVIDGWNEGLIGMKQGTRRLLVVPPEKGYGQGGNGIEPNETLVFVVDAVEVS